MTHQGDASGYPYSVIVPVYNGSATIEACLNALAHQSISPDSYEIIIVDDGSTDNTSQVVTAWSNRHPHLRCQQLRQSNTGPAAARNRGAQIAQGWLLLFTDADCQPCTTWIETFAKIFAADATISAAMGAYTSEQKTAAARFAQLEFEERYVGMATRATIDLVATYSAAFRRDVFLKETGFDPSFPKANNEDVEFSFRLSRQGYRMVFVPAATVSHPHVPTWWGYARTKFGRAFWRTVVYKRYPAKAVKDSYTPQLLKLQIILAPLCLLGLLWMVGQRTATGLLLCVPFLLTTLPMVRFAQQRRSGVALWVPWGLWLRSMVFALGVAWALLPYQQIPQTVHHQAEDRSG
jgi:glycosyltransferase involved in cell wall biosynthesis